MMGRSHEAVAPHVAGEAIANVIVGYGVAVATQILIFPIFGLQTTLAQNLKMGAIFTVVSIARSLPCGGCSRRSVLLGQRGARNSLHPSGMASVLSLTH